MGVKMVKANSIKIHIQKKKLRAICKKLEFKVIELKNVRWKKNRDHMINLLARKI